MTSDSPPLGTSFPGFPIFTSYFTSFCLFFTSISIIIIFSFVTTFLPLGACSLLMSIYAFNAS